MVMFRSYFKKLIIHFSAKYFKTVLLGLIILFSFLVLLKNSFAQQTQNDIIISWQAYNFVPYFFRGKILPTTGSSVYASVDLIQNNKLVNLSKSKIYWYLNNELISNSVGAQKINFIAPSSNVNLRVELPDFGLLKTITIPVVKPKIVINAPFPQKEIKTNYFELNAMPYFFNIPNNDLDFLDVVWKINGRLQKPSAESLFKIKVNITDEFVKDLIVEVSAQNTENPIEWAYKKVNLMFIK